MDLLFQKVNEYLHNSRSLAAGQKKINWIEIGKALKRNHIQCKTRYEREKCEPLGTFTPEEDALIMTRVKQWKNKGTGLWIALSNEMGRARTSVRARYLALCTDMKPRIKWTDELVSVKFGVDVLFVLL